MLGPHLTREEAAKQLAKAPAAHKKGDLFYHNGVILPHRHYPSDLLGHKLGKLHRRQDSGMDTWYSGIGTVSGGAGSSYEATVNEYTDKAGERVSSSITYGGQS